MALLQLLPPCTCGFAQALVKHSSSSSSGPLKRAQSHFRRSISTSLYCLAPNNAGRAGSLRARRAGRNDDVQYNFNANPFDPAPRDSASRATYQNVTATGLRKHTTPPKKVRMLARDFIDDSLYNPNYGYFPKQAVIFDPGAALGKKPLAMINGEASDGAAAVTSTAAAEELESEDIVQKRLHGFDFSQMRSLSDWDRTVAETYGIIEQTTMDGSGPGRQVWHTPTELFKPYYAQAVANHLVTEYKLALYPYNDLKIFEIGAGNGSMMTGVLDYLRDAEPEVYKRTHYHTIEISQQLADLQLARARAAGHSGRVSTTRQSIFDWNQVVTDPCFFLAFEVLDNLPHDVVRYTLEDETPLQCLVEIDERGDFTEVYQPVSDPLIRRFLDIRRDIRRHNPYAYSTLHPLLSQSPFLRRLYASMPFAPNLSPPDFLPTQSLLLLDVLRDKFPAHRILMSDFDHLPDTVPGRLAPVVQTRYEGQSVTCSTYLVSQGWFDIFFPTDFRFLRDMYEWVMAGKDKTHISGHGNAQWHKHLAQQQQTLHDELGIQEEKTQADAIATFEEQEAISNNRRAARELGVGLGWGNRKPLRVLSHRQFLERYGEPEYTMLKDGTNPMLELYENAAFIY